MRIDDAVDVQEAVTEEERTRLRTRPPFGDSVVQPDDSPDVFMEGEPQVTFKALDLVVRSSRQQGLVVFASIFGQPVLKAVPQRNEARCFSCHGAFYINCGGAWDLYPLRGPGRVLGDAAQRPYLEPSRGHCVEHDQDQRAQDQADPLLRETAAAASRSTCRVSRRLSLRRTRSPSSSGRAAPV